MKGRSEYASAIISALGDRLNVRESIAPNELLLSLRPESLSSLPEICSLLRKSFQARFTTLLANDERSINGRFSLYYVFSVAADDIFLTLQVPVDPRHMEVPSISPVLENANWFEREVKDLFGIMAFPNIYRLASHPDWPEDVHPMVKGFDRETAVPRVRGGTFDFKHVEGEGVFEIPVGPIHAGIIEPGHFRFSVAGEPIINLDAQLFYTHKGTEKLAEGMSPRHVVLLAERISGDSSFAHAVAFCRSIERLGDCELTKRAEVVRSMLLELERLYNHIGDIGAILLDVGFSAGAAMAAELKETFLRLNEQLTGSRLLRGIATIGGIRRDPEATVSQRSVFRDTVYHGRIALENIVDLVMSSASVLDRLEGTGKLSHADAHHLGIRGIAGRASGIGRDFRRDHPHCAYAHVDFQPVVLEEGDVLARFKVRVEEVRQAFNILDQLGEQHLDEPLMADVPPPVAHHGALGYVEGWRGEIVHWTMAGRNGEIYRWKITDPSTHNWRGLLVAVRNNIVPDFPVINKSFNLSYSGNDR